VKRVLPNDKKLKQYTPSIKVVGDLANNSNSRCRITEATFTNEHFELSLVRPSVV